MEYEHCWSYSRAHPAYGLAWPALVADTRTIIDAVSAAGIHLAGPAGLSHPIADQRAGIVVNGDARHHENGQTFLVRPPARWSPRQNAGDPLAVVDSCKTGRRCYDLAVAAILLRFAMMLPGAFTILSDGGWDAEWASGASASRRNPPGADTPAALSARALIGDLFRGYPVHRVLA